MKAGIYNPYLDSLGGGERYTMALADCLAQSGWQVDVFWRGPDLKKQLKKRLNLSLEKVNFVSDRLATQKNLFKRWQGMRDYDLIFWLSDGSIPFLFAKRNWLHFQVPFSQIQGKTILNWLKFKQIDRIICNSQFTKSFIDAEYGIKSEVVYPPVAVKDFQPLVKENLILGVGRFSRTLHAKKQEILVWAFRKMCQLGLTDWRLVLVGGLQPEDDLYLNELKIEAKNYPIEFYPNLPFAGLKKLYGQAKIFWHATGFGEEEKINPERTEHFGIVIVEAMAAGAVPVVLAKGGIPETIDQGKDGFLWTNEEELIKQTFSLVKKPKKLLAISKAAQRKSIQFSQEAFCQKINNLICD